MSRKKIKTTPNFRKRFFLILGYGIPRNIFKAENYRLYFEEIVEKLSQVKAEKNQQVAIVFSGGPTDMFPPYDRTEAEEMVHFFGRLKRRNWWFWWKSRGWELVRENESLSTLENLVNTQKLIADKIGKSGRIGIFCEKSRAERIEILAKKIFLNTDRIEVYPVDFDLRFKTRSEQKLIRLKEKIGIEISLKVLASEEGLKRHHQHCLAKMIFLRQAAREGRNGAVEKWWRKVIEKEV